jgi:uncharacterized 2Fe-2S/4Fe-4S cluster protein (DUF4445 family)
MAEQDKKKKKDKKANKSDGVLAECMYHEINEAAETVNIGINVKSLSKRGFMGKRRKIMKALWQKFDLEDLDELIEAGYVVGNSITISNDDLKFFQEEH